MKSALQHYWCTQMECSMRGLALAQLFTDMLQVCCAEVVFLACCGVRSWWTTWRPDADVLHFSFLVFLLVVRFRTFVIDAFMWRQPHIIDMRSPKQLYDWLPLRQTLHLCRARFLQLLTKFWIELTIKDAVLYRPPSCGSSCHSLGVHSDVQSQRSYIESRQLSK